MVFSQFCRACGSELKDACKIENNPAKPELPLLLKRYVPEFNIEVENACLCIGCVFILYNFHNFKRKCLRTEEDLRLHIRKHPEVKAVNLNDIFASKEQTNNTTLDTEETIETVSTSEARLSLKTTANQEVPIKKKTIDDTAPQTVTSLPTRRRLTCDICSRVFCWEQSLNTHKRQYHGRERFLCDQCGRDFVFQKDYHAHLAYHKSPKADRFVCKECNFVYQSSSALTRHMCKHLSQDRKPLQCEVCSMRFLYRSALIKHMRTHTGKKSYACSMCEYSTHVKSRLDRHISARHKKTNAGYCVYNIKVL